MARGRKRYYTNSVLTVGDNVAISRFKASLVPTEARRHFVDFQDFCNINALSLSADSFASYAAVLLHHDMDPGSVITRQKNVMSEIRRGGVITWANVKKELGIQKARLGRRHARDAPISTLAAALDVCPSCVFRQHLLVIMLCGARNADLEEQNDDTWKLAVTQGVARISMEVMVAKQRRLPQDHTTLTLSGRLIPWEELSEGLRRDALRWRPSVGRASTAKLLSWMKKQPSIKGFTTYTFRRNYVHRMITAFSGEDDLVQWKSVTEKTLHFSEKTVKASYMIHTSDE